jgi:hypothetical protein
MSIGPIGGRTRSVCASGRGATFEPRLKVKWKTGIGKALEGSDNLRSGQRVAALDRFEKLIAAVGDHFERVGNEPVVG